MIERASNFAFLKKLELPLWRLGLFAEHYFPNDPNTCSIKLRQLTEQVTQRLAARSGLYVSQEESQYDLLRRLLDHGLLSQQIHSLFSEVRRSGNLAAHDLRDDHRSALAAMRFTWQLAIWYHRTFAEPTFKSGAFMPPQAASSKISYSQLTAELVSMSDTAVLTLVRDQLVAKLQRKRHHMTRSALLEFEAHTPLPPLQPRANRRARQ